MKLPELTVLPAEDRLKKLGAKIARSRKAVKRGIRFLDSSFLLPPGPSLLLAHTGKGKTNCLANQVHHALRTSNGLIVCALNEETDADFYARIACIRLNLNFSEYKLDQLSPEMLDTVYGEIKILMPRVVVIDQEEFNLNSLEDMLTVIKAHCMKAEVSLIVIDYLQNITETKTDELAELASWGISKEFGKHIKEYGKTAMCPILIAAQVNPGDEDAVSRVQNDRTIGNHAKTIIELHTNFDVQETEASIEKDRFNSCTGKVYVFKYKQGLLSFLSEKNTFDSELP